MSLRLCSKYTVIEFLQTASPEDVGLSAKQLARLDHVLQGYIDRQELAGIVTLVARFGQIVHSAQFGFMDIVGKRPMMPDTIFRIASMAKPITSVAAMMLFERGHFSLSDPIANFIPEFKEVVVFGGEKDGRIEWQTPHTEITFHHLLTHTSGLGYPESYNKTVAALYKAADPNGSKSLAELTNKLARLPLYCQPGSQWHYGYSHDVMARLVEIISGRDYGEYLEEEIFRPLGMVDTAYYVPEEKINRLASLYQKDDFGNFDEVKITNTISPPGLKPGGHGLFSTAPDYLRFAQMMANGGHLDAVRLISPDSVELMTTNHLSAELLPMQFSPDDMINGQGYGFGFGIVMDPNDSDFQECEGSYHWNGAFGTTFLVVPQSNLIGILMTQTISPGLPPFRKQFRSLVYETITN